MSTFQFDVGQAVQASDGRRGTIASRSAAPGLQPMYLFRPAGASVPMRWMREADLRPVLPETSAAPSVADRVEYFALLKTHDWEFEQADDGSVYRRGREQRRRLEALQPAVDPDCAAWNRSAPAAYQRHSTGSPA